VSRVHAARRAIFGGPDSIAGTVYGTIVVMAVIAGGSRGAETDLRRLAVLAAATAVVIWVAHVYAHALSNSIAADRRFGWSDILGIAKHEAAVPLAGVAPVAAVVLGALGVVGEQAAIRLALAVGVAALAVQGVRYARVERRSLAGTLAAVAANVTLGLVIVAFEVVLAH
jgi:hypothetical protein